MLFSNSSSGTVPPRGNLGTGTEYTLTLLVQSMHTVQNNTEERFGYSRRMLLAEKRPFAVKSLVSVFPLGNDDGHGSVARWSITMYAAEWSFNNQVTVTWEYACVFPCSREQYSGPDLLPPMMQISSPQKHRWGFPFSHDGSRDVTRDLHAFRHLRDPTCMPWKLHGIAPGIFARVRTVH